MSTVETYQARAADCLLEAELTTLPNVREQCLRAALAWQSMADRALLAEKYRADEAARKSCEPAWRSAPRPHRP